MAQDTAKADAILKDYYLPVVREMVNQKALLLFGYSPDDIANGAGTMNAAAGETMDYRGISRNTENLAFAGRKWIKVVHTKRNESGTMRDEGGTLPAAGEQGWDDLSDQIRRAYKQIQLSGFSIELTEGRSIGAYLSLMEAETEGAINDLRKDLNRQAFSDQTGKLCDITADGANTVTVDTTQYIRVGMFIDIINSGTNAVLASNRKITAINTSTKVVTYDGADVAAVAGTHVLCVEGNWKKEINGLRNITRSDLYPTLHNVDSSVAGNEWWKAKQKDGGNATLDEDQAQQLLDEIGADGRESEMIITTRGIRRRYVNTLKAQKRFNDGNSLRLHGGFKYVDFDGMPLLYDDDCPKKHAFFLVPGGFVWANLNGMDFNWMQRDGAILRKVENPDQDAYKGTLYKYCDLGVMDRRSQGVIYNLADET